MREIPIKNYIKLILICIFVICLSVVSSIWYKRNESIKLNIPVVRGHLPEITPSNLDDYLIEHEDAYLYLGVASDENSRALEKSLIKVLNKYDITQDTVYLNISDVENKEEFYKKYNETYSVNDKLSNYPAFIIIKDNKMYKMIQRDNDFLTKKELDKFLGDNL